MIIQIIYRAVLNVLKVRSLRIVLISPKPLLLGRNTISLYVMEYKMMIHAVYPNLKNQEALAGRTHFNLADKTSSSHWGCVVLKGSSFPQNK